MTTKPFTFPSFRAFYNDAPLWGEARLKFVWRCFWKKKRINAFCQWVNSHWLWHDFFCAFPNEAYPLIHVYLDKRLRGKRRLTAIIHDLNTAEQLFGETLIRQFIDDKPLILGSLNEDWSLWLNHNNICSDEGWWAVSLRDKQGKHVYSASFGFIEPHRLLITSVQGPVGDEAKDLVRQLTKTLHGLRPQQLMITVILLLAEKWGLDTIGIAQAQQVKLRWKLKKRVSINYDAVWQEYQAQLGTDGYWHLPKQLPRKEFSEISSQKRSMYRKRYAMLDALHESLSGSLKI